MNTKGLEKHIRVNLPENHESEISGYGEGCWALVDADTKAAYDRDETGGRYYAILDNDSIYYPGIDHGAIIQISLRGTARAVASVDYLKALQIIKSAADPDELHELATSTGTSWAELWEAYKDDGALSSQTIHAILGRTA